MRIISGMTHPVSTGSVPENLSPLPDIPVTKGLIVLLLVCYGITTFPTFTAPQEWAFLCFTYYTPSVIPLPPFEPFEWWRLITANLMHGGLGHLASNVFMLWIFGRMLEPVLGAKRMVWLYVLTGLSASVFLVLGDWLELILWQAEPVPALGASGMDYGVLGAAMMLQLMVRRIEQPERFGKDIMGYLVLVAVYTYMNLTEANIGYWAHLGGFLMGLLLGWIYFQAILKNARVSQAIS